MILCDDNHEEIVYSSNSGHYSRGKCPLCYALKKIEELEEERIEELSQLKEE